MASSAVQEKRMRAFRAQAGAKEAQLDVINIPQVGAQDVLIKVVSAGLVPGPFTLLSQGRLSQLPTTLGHQVAGLVAQVGDLVDGVQIGQRVRVHPSVSCGLCKYCTTGRDQMCPESAIIGFCGFGAGRMPAFEEYHEGGLAEYIRVPSNLVDVLPENVSFDVGAKLHDLANAMRVLSVAELEPGSTVIITAPTGTMGTSCVKLAPFFGIGHLILVGRSTERLNAVKNLTNIKCDVVGLDNIGDDWLQTKGLVRRVRQLCPQGVEAIIDFMPSGTDIYQIMGSLALHGSLVHMGGNASIFPVPLIAIMVNCWRIIGTRNHSRADAKTVLRWLQEGQLNVDDLITHKFSLDQIDEAVARLRDRTLPESPPSGADFVLEAVDCSGMDQVEFTAMNLPSSQWRPV